MIKKFVRRLGIKPSSRLELGIIKPTKVLLNAILSYLINKVAYHMIKDKRYSISSSNEISCVSYTDKYAITINKNVKGYSDLYEYIDIVIGYLIHEIGHILYTPMSSVDIDELKELSNTYGKELPQMVNLIEDVRIESTISDQFSGAGDYLVRSRNNIVSDIESHKNTIEYGLFNIVYLYYSYPTLYEEVIDDPKRNKYNYKDEDIKKICIIPKVYTDTVSIAIQLLMLRHKDDKTDTSDYSTDQKPGSNGKGSNGKGSGSKSESNGTSTKENQDSVTESVSFTETNETSSEMVDINAFSKGTIGTNVDKIKWEYQTRFNKSKYDSVRNSIGSFSTKLRNELLSFNTGGLKVNSRLTDGKIDSRFLSRVMMDDDKVFKIYSRRFNKPIDIVMLIDQSGSMSGNKISDAMKVSIMLNDAFIGINNINYWCYGHTADNEYVKLFVYQEGPVSKATGMNLTSMDAYYGNCDGRAILECANRVNNQIGGNDDVLFILISDGMPTESCGGIDPEKYAMDAARYVEDKLHFNFLHIGINCDNHKLYRNSIDYVNPSQLSVEISKKIRSFVTRLRKVEVNR